MVTGRNELFGNSLGSSGSLGLDVELNLEGRSEKKQCDRALLPGFPPVLQPSPAAACGAVPPGRLRQLARWLTHTASVTRKAPWAVLGRDFQKLLTFAQGICPSYSYARRRTVAFLSC